MARGHDTNANGGMIPAPRRGPARVALDLWRAGGSFRGFIEFSLIGAVVLAFLPGPGSTALSVIMQLFSSGQHAATPTALPDAGTMAAPGATAELPPSFNDRNKTLAPRIGDLKITPDYFERVQEPLRGRLRAALAAYDAHRAGAVEQILAAGDPEDPRVLLMRGLASLSLPGPASTQAGIAMLERSADKAEPRAVAMLGVLKLAGMAGYARDTEDGRRLIERAVEASDAPAARVLAEGYLSGWSGTVDPARAQRYLRLASERGDVQATFRLGEMLFTGHGVEKNPAEAERLFLKAATAGHVEAQAMFGMQRLTGYLAGLTADPNEALAWLERAAAQDEPHALFYLGVFYMEYGKRAGRLDLPRGAELFRRCAETTLHGECVFAYATALDLGVGVPRDPVKAYALYSLSIMLNNQPKATQKRNALGKDLSPDQITRANALITELMQRQQMSSAQAPDRFRSVQPR